MYLYPVLFAHTLLILAFIWVMSLQGQVQEHTGLSRTPQALADQLRRQWRLAGHTQLCTLLLISINYLSSYLCCCQDENWLGQ